MLAKMLNTIKPIISLGSTGSSPISSNLPAIFAVMVNTKVSSFFPEAKFLVEKIKEKAFDSFELQGCDWHLCSCSPSSGSDVVRLFAKCSA